MSLLLDALKKAADDKQKAAGNNLSSGKKASPKEQVVDSTTNKNSSQTVKKREPDVVVTLETQSLSLAHADDDVVKKVASNEYTEELTLDEIPVEEKSAAVVLEISDAVKNDSKKDVVSKTPQSEGLNSENINTSKEKYSISDDGLSLLIYKTNRDVKRIKKLLFLVS
ncbi:MAG: hypothetical protein JKX75_09075 [Gammaproteobacteria bacterium]|nr:hypothetical protein [Gammaproteobacteria bacterium]